MDIHTYGFDEHKPVVLCISIEDYWRQDRCLLLFFHGLCV